jgi:hypothetical protein
MVVGRCWRAACAELPHCWVGACLLQLGAGLDQPWESSTPFASGLEESATHLVTCSEPTRASTRTSRSFRADGALVCVSGGGTRVRYILAKLNAGGT